MHWLWEADTQFSMPLSAMMSCECAKTAAISAVVAEHLMILVVDVYIYESSCAVLLQLLDSASGDQAGKLCNAASNAAISLCSWQDGCLGVGPPGKELIAVGDGDGGVNLLEVDLDDTVGNCLKEFECCLDDFGNCCRRP